MQYEPEMMGNPSTAAGHHYEVEERELPRATKLLEESFKDLQDNFVGYLVVGLPAFCVAMGLAVFGVFAFFLGMIPMAAAGSDEGIFVFFLTWMGIFWTVTMLISVPLHAGQGRAIWRHLTKGEAMTFGSPLKEIGKDLPAVFGSQFLIGVLACIGMLFFIFPVFLVVMLCSFSLPAVIAHRMGAFESLALSAGHARKHFWWHTKVWVLGMLVAMAASQVPILGTIMAGPWLLSYTLRAYRAAFGDGETLPINS